MAAGDILEFSMLSVTVLHGFCLSSYLVSVLVSYFVLSSREGEKG